MFVQGPIIFFALRRSKPSRRSSRSGSVELKEEVRETFQVLKKNLGDKTISQMVLENIVVHLSHIEITMKKYFPVI